MEQLNSSEKAYLENEEYNKNNREEVVSGKKISNRAKFKMTHGYSATISKLMEKYGCKTVEEYREVRKANRKKKVKPTPSKAPVSVQSRTQPRKK